MHGLVFPMFWAPCASFFIGFSNVLGSLCVIFIGCSNVLGSLCVTFIGFSNVLGSRRALFIGFSNVCVFWKPKTLEKPIKTIKTIIFKLSPDGGVAPGDSLKIMVFMVFIGFSNVLGSLCVIFIGFSNVLGSLCVIFIGFSNVCVFWKPKTLEKPIKTIKTIIFKLSPDGGVAPGDSLKIMVFMVFIGFSNVLGSLCVIFIGFSNVLGSLCVIFIGFSNVCVFWKPKTLEKPIKTIKTIIFQTISRWWCRAWR